MIELYPCANGCGRDLEYDGATCDECAMPGGRIDQERGVKREHYGMTAAAMIKLARKHIGKGDMVSSARLCLNDAIEVLEAGDSESAKRRARESLRYSIGILHRDFPQ